MNIGPLRENLRGLGIIGGVTGLLLTGLEAHRASQFSPVHVRVVSVELQAVRSQKGRRVYQPNAVVVDVGTGRSLVVNKFSPNRRRISDHSVAAAELATLRVGATHTVLVRQRAEEEVSIGADQRHVGRELLLTSLAMLLLVRAMRAMTKDGIPITKEPA